jgi:leucyl aminopeptidase (aminopeptidase T)
VFAGGLLGTIPIGRKYGPIRQPIRLRIEAGKVIDLEVSDPGLRRDLEFCLYFDRYTSQVNEIGFGTNPAIRRPVRGYNYKHEESRMGFHLGFGASLAQQNVERLTPHHLDFLLEDCVMHLDGALLFDGSYHPDNFAAATSGDPLRLSARTCCMPSQGTNVCAHRST